MVKTQPNCISQEFPIEYLLLKKREKIKDILKMIIKKNYYYAPPIDNEAFSGIIGYTTNNNMIKNIMPNSKIENSNLNIFFLEKELGRGNFGVVYKAFPLLHKELNLGIRIINSGEDVFFKSGKKLITLNIGQNFSNEERKEESKDSMEKRSNNDITVSIDGVPINLFNFLGYVKCLKFKELFKFYKDIPTKLAEQVLPLFIDMNTLTAATSALKVESPVKYFFVKTFFKKDIPNIMQRWKKIHEFHFDSRVLIIDFGEKFKTIYKDSNHSAYDNLGFNTLLNDKDIPTCDLTSISKIKPNTFYLAEKVLSKDTILGLIPRIIFREGTCHASDKDIQKSLVKEIKSNIIYDGFKSFFRNHFLNILEQKLIPAEEIFNALNINLGSNNTAFSIKDKLELSIAIGDAILDFTRKTGKSHGDISNGNILCDKTNNKWRVFLIDFGKTLKFNKYINDFRRYKFVVEQIFAFKFPSTAGNATYKQLNSYMQRKGIGNQILNQESYDYKVEYEVYELLSSSDSLFSEESEGTDFTLGLVSHLQNIYAKYLDLLSNPPAIKLTTFLENLLYSQNKSFTFMNKIDFAIFLAKEFSKRHQIINLKDILVKKEKNKYSFLFNNSAPPNTDSFLSENIKTYLRILENLFLFVHDVNSTLPEMSYKNINTQIKEEGVSILNRNNKYFIIEKEIFELLKLYKNNTESLKELHIIDFSKVSLQTNLENTCVLGGGNHYKIFEKNKIIAQGTLPHSSCMNRFSILKRQVAFEKIIVKLKNQKEKLKSIGRDKDIIYSNNEYTGKTRKLFFQEVPSRNKRQRTLSL